MQRVELEKSLVGVSPSVRVPCSLISVEPVLWQGATSPSPRLRRLRGEGRGEGAYSRAPNRGEAPSPCALKRDYLSPRAGRGNRTPTQYRAILRAEGGEGKATSDDCRADTCR
jgi:hypothetical protein